MEGVLLAVLVGAAGILIFVIWRMSGTNNAESLLEPDAARDVVVLHQLGHGPSAPSISPFVMKLETYLRVANIPYENRYDRIMGPKGKVPWIQYNDDVICDSQHVIEYLNLRLGVNLNKGLTNQQHALGHIVRRMAEEWVYNVLIVFRLQFDKQTTLYRQLGLNSLVIWYLRRVSMSRAWGQGIGRHSREEVMAMLENDLTAIQEIIGNRTYLFGDAITEYDCALFGQLSELCWQTPGTGVEELIKEKYPKLVEYCERIKQTVWPDWEDHLLVPTPSSSTSQPTQTAT